VTAQIDDRFSYKGNEYCLAGISEGELFDPESLGVKPVGACTACWRGYLAVFGILDGRLIVRDLHVSLFPDSVDLLLDTEEPEDPGEALGPEINGVKPARHDPEEEDCDWFDNHYFNIAHRLDYTGGLLLADGFIEELYVHMGFHPAWKYRTVLELVFENGRLVREHDRSERLAKFREEFMNASAEAGPDRTPTEDEVSEFVRDAFDRSYGM